jgi:hypothetical protein
MNSGLSRILLLVILLLPAYAGDQEECVIPAGPPCIPLGDPRLKDPTCRFEVGACISLQWDEYGGDLIIEAAEIRVTPSCSSPSTADAFEQKGRNYLESLQTLPIEIAVVKEPCASKGFVDVKITRTRRGTPP